MSDMYEVCFDERAASIPSRFMRNLSTRGHAVVIAKQFCAEDATSTEIAHLADAILARKRRLEA